MHSEESAAREFPLESLDLGLSTLVYQGIRVHHVRDCSADIYISEVSDRNPANRI